MPIHRGSAAECLRHFAKTDFNGNKRAVLAAFTRISSDSTMRRWLNQGHMPAGESLIRLHYYLDFIGYQVKELKSLSSAIRDLGRLYAFGVVELDDIVQLIGAPRGENGRGQVRQTLFGETTPSKGRMDKILAFIKDQAPPPTKTVGVFFLPKKR